MLTKWYKLKQYSKETKFGSVIQKRTKQVFIKAQYNLQIYCNLILAYKYKSGMFMRLRYTVEKHSMS